MRSDSQKRAISNVFLFVISLLYFSSGGSDAKYVRTPKGLAWDKCVIKVPSGTHIIQEEGKAVKLEYPDGKYEFVKPCSKKVLPQNHFTKKSNLKARDSPDDGWQAWTAFNNINNATFDVFTGSFSVPPVPNGWDGGILYMFTGLQNDNWVPINGEFPTPPGFDIIQPVLQFGQSPAGGGSFWALASWYVTLDSNVFFSDLENVNAGDIIFGNMSRTAPTTWFISGGVVGSGQSTSISATDPRLLNQAWAYCTLEVYDIDDCSNDFPPSGSAIKFTQLALYDQGGKHQVIPTWQSLNNQGDHCQANANIYSPSSVSITF